ncbi:cytochrome c1 [Wenxinia saemankumensis]|uniref:Cytochrome c1 n=1 Tax=Wenxinia saemankumensis TaxID=1447782 RepID=A0A1M6E2E2_9RHOB|nr:cytochrome c1 [Wenxinia saemankumensis]SHI79672.1 ubiquinol-cytochrome c reductase cytochrome c1 subunit [Wenxinia saemankumensis]
MLKKLALSALLGLSALGTGTAALAAGEAHVEDFDFPFEGPFGSYDPLQLQRGLKIYTEVCAACHGLQYLSYRNLSEEGGPMLPEDQMRAYAAQYEVFDETLADGQGDYRPATPADRFGRSAVANAPDLSLMAKARAGFHGPYGLGINQILYGMGGPEYIASLMVGYEEAPECAIGNEPAGFYYNTAFANGSVPDSCRDEHGHVTIEGSWIAMPPPLLGEDVVFDDGHENDLHHEAADVAAFLMWTAEPHLNARKAAGMQGMIFLVILAALLYLTNKRLWAPHKTRVERDH